MYYGSHLGAMGKWEEAMTHVSWGSQNRQRKKNEAFQVEGTSYTKYRNRNVNDMYKENNELI